MSGRQNAPDRYDPRAQSELLRRVDAIERAAYVRGRDVIVGLPDALLAGGARNQRLILVSPNGTQYQIVVDDAGALSTVAVA